MALFRTGLYVKDHSVEKVQVASTPIASYNGNVTGLYIPEIVAMINAIQASGTPAPDNVIPIYGWNGVLVNRCGSNWWDEEWEVGSINVNTGNNDNSVSDRIRSKNYFPCLPNTTYYFSTQTSAQGLYCIPLFYDKNKNYIGYIINGVYSPKSTTNANYQNPFTSLNNAYYMRFFVAPSYGTTYNNDICINYPSTDTNYHAFVGNPYIWYFEGLLNGIYDFVDFGTLEWTYVQGSVNYFRASLSDHLIGSLKMICSLYETKSSTGVSGMTNMMITCSANSDYIYVRDDTYTDAVAFTAAMSGVYLIYEKATASSPSITQAQADTLLTAFDVEDKSVIIVFDQTVYGGYVNVETGVLTITHANIASYNGESINEPWLSSMDEYSSGATPTTGAQVVYPLTTPITVQLTPKQLEQLLMNNVFADTGNVAVKFYNVIR